VITRLARVGYDHAIGYLKGGFSSWLDGSMEYDSIPSISPVEVANKMKTEEVHILDVRRKSEYDSEHVIGAENAPLDYINESMKAIDPNKTYHVHCAGGYRSMVFISILKARGYHNLVDIQGGFKEVKASEKFEVSDYVCPSTLL
jgi:hydroxyacylglutathione hydrolase